MSLSADVPVAPPRVNLRALGLLALLAVAVLVVPVIASPYVIEAILLPFLALSLAGLGLNLLTGYGGQVSLGSAAFMAVGAFAAYNFQLRLGVSLPLAIVLAAATAAAIGVVFGLPSLRLRGFYLAVSTLAAQFFVQWALTKFSWFSNDSASGVVAAPRLTVASLDLDAPQGRYLFALTLVVGITFLVHRIVGSRAGVNLIAVRDDETAAKVIGVPVLRTKLVAFAISSAIIGVAGVIWAYAYLRTVEPAGFNLDRSFQVLFIIIIGGLATIRGAFLGAALIVVFPLLLARTSSFAFEGLVDAGVLKLVERVVLGLVIILFLIAEPNGLSAILGRATARLRAVLRRG
ncbi:branched-chain amino acid ABC transporter permease [Xanthobacter agilis]|jgi:branched-chain amino acid transport system permease protein|uniref:Branched-chain amino acid transport system permease protein n=1 Tax=Xanthobacter agilis TaxID=47492 RepID=A0ABU0LFD1_XANAG|nr:branched-chain amino acid ABC transporter permease [Xanthobacter agilis]MDQ0505857.1 branched-chain amino acid transport system permease protein [Xanthobacter agilis]